MLAAEEWYEYQKTYKRYGIDMRPASTLKRNQPCKSKSPIMNAKDKTRLIALIFFLGALCICLIISAAYSTQIKFETNRILAKTDVVQGEIENLNVAIKSANNISAIEERAVNELGMVYPQRNQIAYINFESKEDPEFAETLKQLAFKK